MNSSVYATYRLLEQQTQVGMTLVSVMKSAFWEQQRYLTDLFSLSCYSGELSTPRTALKIASCTFGKPVLLSVWFWKFTFIALRAGYSCLCFLIAENKNLGASVVSNENAWPLFRMYRSLRSGKKKINLVFYLNVIYINVLNCRILQSVSK